MLTSEKDLKASLAGKLVHGNWPRVFRGKKIVQWKTTALSWEEGIKRYPPCVSVVSFEPVTSVVGANKESNKAQCASKQLLRPKQNSHNTKCRYTSSSIHGQRSRQFTHTGKEGGRRGSSCSQSNWPPLQWAAKRSLGQGCLREPGCGSREKSWEE